MYVLCVCVGDIYIGRWLDTTEAKQQLAARLPPPLQPFETKSFQGNDTTTDHVSTPQRAGAGVGLTAAKGANIHQRMSTADSDVTIDTICIYYSKPFSPFFVYVCCISFTSSSQHFI